MSHTATSRSVGGLRQEIEVNRRHTIATDEPASLGGDDTAPTPQELLPAMLASCVSTMIVLYAQRREWRIGEVRVDVNYNADSAPRRVEVTVHLPHGLSDEQIERLRRVADTCPVKRALETGFTFEQQLVLDVPVPDRTANCPAGCTAAGMYDTQPAGASGSSVSPGISGNRR